LRDQTGLDFGDRSWICNAALVVLNTAKDHRKTAQDRKGLQKDARDLTGPLLFIYLFFVWLPEKVNTDECIRDLVTAEKSHDVTIEWYAPPTALVGFGTSAYTILVAS